MGKKSFPLRTGKPKALGQDQGNVRQILLLGFDSLAVIFRILVLRFFFFFCVCKHIPTLYSDSTLLYCLSSLCRPLMGVDNLSWICEYVILNDSKKDKCHE